MSIRYLVRCDALNAHLYDITLRIGQPVAGQRLSLPVWIPGSYLVREFARQLRGLQARQGTAPVALRQTDKNHWEAACQSGEPLEISYQVYALDSSVRAAWLDAQRGFFNGTSLLLRVHGQEDLPHELDVRAPAATRGWRLATGLAPVKVRRDGFGLYRARDYDELVDCPVEMGAFWRGDFVACGVPHRFVIAGAAPSMDGKRLLADAQRICQATLRMWHGPQADARARDATHRPPMDRYVFMLNVVDDGYGGLEHRNSTALICKRADLPRQGESKPGEGYTVLLGLIAHEYFHTWNVKRLRPREFTRYDYDQENYTRLLWFFEGFTSYYDDLLVYRAGLLDEAGYLRQLQKSVTQVLQTPGRQVQSVAQASFDAWTRYYRPDEGTPNGTVSYYSKGALVALCLDLTLRAEGRTTLDAVMRELWRRCDGGPMSEDDLLDTLRDLAGRSLAREIAAWVHGTRELPLATLLARHGVNMAQDTAPLAQRLGLRVAESDGSVRVRHVLSGGAAEAAGFSPGDEWLGVGTRQGQWRLSRLDDIPVLLGDARQLEALVARDRRLLRLKLRTGATVRSPRLVVREADRVKAWLAG